MIQVTKPFLPPMEAYIDFLKSIWNRNWLTNNGPLVNELELKLKEYLKLNHLLFVSNGTIAIQIAIKALGLKGEIITTPFSYVATTSSIVWEGCIPVFVDIDSETLNLDPNKIEESITEKTSAIIATHVFGNPCDVKIIGTIAKKHGLKVIYDGAHAFGVNLNGKSVFEYGDISTCSFHATKLFHTIEGGGIFTQDPILLKRMAYMRNFGHDGPGKYNGVGINGKNSEFHAAMGLVNLKYVALIIQNRKELAKRYDQYLLGKNIVKPLIFKDIDWNHSYYPVIFNDANTCIKIFRDLELKNIYCRRYFYPNLTKLDYVNEYFTPIAEDISNRILCLPMYYGLEFEEVDMICRYILRMLSY